jgi:hypothetical protein
MIHRLAWLSTVVVLAVGCTSTPRLQTAAAPSSSAAGSSSSALPPTRCPADNPFGHAGSFDEQTAIQGNLIFDYGLAHKDEFMGYQVVAAAGGYGFKVSFSGHLAEHEAAIRGIIEPTRSLEMAQANHTPAEVAAVAGDLGDWQRIPGVVGSSLPYDGGLPAIRLTMAPGSEAKADLLIAKYGDLVSIEISYIDYFPAGCGSPSANPCSIQASQPLLPPTSPTVTATLEMPASFSQSAEANGSFRVTNSGTTDLAFYGSGSGLGGSIIDPASGTTIGEFRGSFTADLHPWLFPVGTTAAIPARVSAMACGGSVLSLKPGSYLARIQISLGPAAASSDPAGFMAPTVTVSADTAILITSP